MLQTISSESWLSNTSWHSASYHYSFKPDQLRWSWCFNMYIVIPWYLSDSELIKLCTHWILMRKKCFSTWCLLRTPLIYYNLCESCCCSTKENASSFRSCWFWHLWQVLERINHEHCGITVPHGIIYEHIFDNIPFLGKDEFYYEMNMWLPAPIYLSLDNFPQLPSDCT